VSTAWCCGRRSWPCSLTASICRASSGTNAINDRRRPRPAHSPLLD